MRKLTLCASLLCITLTSFAQQADTLKPLTPESYLKKGKTQNTVAWVLTSSGIVVLGYTAFAAAMARTAENVSNFVGGVLTGAPPQREKRSFAVPITIGLGALVGSIPLFSAAAKNKKKAFDASVYLGTEDFPTLANMGISNSTCPSLIVRIRL